MPLLEVEGLRAGFATDQGEARVVDGVSFHVDEGEAVGLVGESGCGKTVTALSIMGLLPRPPGRILPGSSVRLRGGELVGMPERELRRVRGDRIAMIFQEPMSALNPVLTVGDQIAEALRAHRAARRAEARAAAADLLREVGFPRPAEGLHAYPHQLSGGMRQRVMIAMALSCRPDLLIADEPTTALDVTIQAQILSLLAELGARRRMALLLITHDLGVVSEFCDRVLVMYAGQVVESGSVAEVFRSPLHPYTRALLDSLPGAADEGALQPIPGSVPSPLALPDGCRFRPRCVQGVERCLEPPPLLPIGEGSSDRLSRCWLARGLGYGDGGWEEERG